MSKITIDIKDNLKWNKSSSLENDLYIKMYLSALNQSLNTSDKQSIFLISKYFTDGAAEVGRGNLEMASYYFKIGERYRNISSSNNIIFNRIIDNVYHRSKSFYYHKTKDFETAITLITQTLENNKYLEKNGFEFFIYDRVQQYYNLSRIYFAKNESDYAFKILSDSTCFLIENKCTFLTELNDNCLKDFNTDIVRLRFSLLCQFICDTADQLQKISDKKIFYSTSIKYFSTVIKSAKKFKILYSEDQQLKDWILLLELFYTKKNNHFKSRAKTFFNTPESFYGIRPKNITDKFLQLL